MQTQEQETDFEEWPEDPNVEFFSAIQQPAMPKEVISGLVENKEPIYGAKKIENTSEVDQYTIFFKHGMNKQNFY